MTLRTPLLLRISLLLLSLAVSAVHAQVPLQSLRANFIKPPDQYKPGVYWYFMDGNMTSESITKDLESMKQAGIGNLVFLEVNVGVPRGKVDFLSESWKSLFVFAEKEARRLGIEITLGIGPGWTGSGGPWVRPDQSMKHLVSSQVSVSDASPKQIVLPVPLPKKPFFGEGNLTEDFKKDWMHYYEDVAVLAFPEVEKGETIADYEEKALFYRAPYSSGEVRPLMPSPSAQAGNQKSAIQKNRIIDLSGRMQPDGTLNWTPPAGRWTVMRFASRNNGAITRPASFPGLGFEADKFDTTAINGHLDVYVGSLLKRIGKIDKDARGGLKRLHMDSWEMGAQNWTANFRKEFLKRRGYDPLKYYPVYAGSIVGSTEESERFLWDLRQTSQELVLENHAAHVRKYAHRHDLELSIEPYDMNPTSDLDLGSIADVPMAEFWSKGFGFNSTYTVIEATSIGHIMGKSLIPAEAFTAQGGEGWQQYPGSVKNQGDWAFAAGINRFVYHTFQNQFLADSLKPGATMGPYGVHWDRSQTWWPMAGGYHDYITRAQYLLQQGRTVADILYLTPEGSPLVFVPPSTAIAGDTIGDRRGYNFDGCSPAQLLKASVKNKRVVFPGGASYRMLVLPAYESMTPALLAKIEELVRAGATVAGSPPLRSPSLADYPSGDQQLRQMGLSMWGALSKPVQETFRSYGKGQLIWGGGITGNPDGLYPRYEVTAKILTALELIEDFKADGPVRYTHRTDDNWDLYFVSNTTDQPIEFTAEFRAVKGSPELWDAVSGKITRTSQFEATEQKTRVPLKLAAWESVFVLFSAEHNWKSAAVKQEQVFDPLLRLEGSWDVEFDPAWGGPAHQEFSSLTDWSKNENEGIRYYSGTAVYHKKFNLSAADLKTGAGAIYLDLGKVKHMARVKLNGKDLGVVWTAPWRLDISGLVKKRNNKLSIEVVNLWPNRLIGDEHKPYDGIVNEQWPAWLLNKQPRTSGRYTFTSSQPYKADTPLFESGLLGPVTILKKKTVEKLN